VISVTDESGADKALSSRTYTKERTMFVHMLSPSSAGKNARSDSIPAGFACLKTIAAAFAQLEKARLAKKLKAARDRRRRRNG
jgi:hypothetical protein